VNARIVYWGIEGAGKRTSLAGVYRKLRPDHRGEMRDVPTRFDPSVSYTVLPIELGDVGGLRTRIELVAVPGAPEHAPTRKQLLDQVDGIVLVVDCQRERAEENLTSLEELAKALEDYARSIDEIPLVGPVQQARPRRRLRRRGAAPPARPRERDRVRGGRTDGTASSRRSRRSRRR
jgi:signal recognition particle receptor subunit beta